MYRLSSLSRFHPRHNSSGISKVLGTPLPISLYSNIYNNSILLKQNKSFILTSTFSTASSSPVLDWNTVKQLPSTEKVVIYYKTYCKFCKDIVDRLEDAGVSMKEVPLDKYQNGNEIRDHLRAETGQEHVPYLFIGGKLIKSEDALVGLKKPGSIKTILENSGVKVTGFFRT